MSEARNRSLSKYVSYLLRHHPEAAGITLDANGWADVEKMLEGMNKNNKGATVFLEDLQEIAASGDKQRFEFNADHTKLRALHGHSVQVDVQHSEEQPPEILYHGTTMKVLDQIMDEGLTPQQRLQVHLSTNIEMAADVGRRRGKPIILKVSAGQMHDEGYKFYRSANGVWLTDRVPAIYLEQMQ